MPSQPHVFIVKTSAKTEYACIAMFELARSWGSTEPVRIRSIAQQHGIPPRFLVQILLQLKGAGFVTSTRGAAGGYQLLKPPEEITLGDVMMVIEGDEPQSSSAAPHSQAARMLQSIWHEVSEVQRDMLAAVTLADLVERAGDQTQHMYYI